MRSRFLPLLLPFVFATAAQAQSAPVPILRDPRATAARLDEHVRRLAPFGFSGSLLIAKDGEVVLSSGYGMADREAGVSVTAETVFDIGSITKQFTAAAILRLEMEGRLSVNDPVTRWFDGVPEDKRTMTLHHLLTHSSGLRGDFGGDYAVAERDSLAGVILGSELLWAPGTRYEYSNAGYSLLGMVVEKASGMGYEAYLRERLWTPAGMTRTGYRGVRWDPRELAVGYAAGGRRTGTPVDQPWAPDGPWWNLRANGGVLSTVTDLFRWHRALEGDAILSAEAKAKMWSPHVPEDEEGSSHYGYGWAIMPTTRDTRLIAHNGGNGIFFADFRRYVDEGVVLLVMSNTTEMGANAVLPIMTRTLFGGEVVAPPAEVAGDTARAAALAGRWAMPDGATLVVTADGPRLRVAPHGPTAFALLRGVAATPEMLARGERAARMFTEAARGDYAPLVEGFGGRRSEAEVRESNGEFMAELTERLGAFRDIEHVGTAPRGPGIASELRMRFERGTQLVRVIWEGETIGGVQFLREAPATVFVPVAEDAWASYDVATGASLRLRMEDGALVVESPGGPVRATRAG